MLFSRLFKKTKALDKNLERNLLFAPNYLINTEEINDGTRYTMGGHSILVIEKNDTGKGLYFERTRTSKSNKFTLDPAGKMYLGFQSVQNKHYLILGIRKNLSNFNPGDRLELKFKNDAVLKYTLETPEDNFGDSKNYACNLRVQLSLEDLELFKTKLLHSYTFTSKSDKNQSIQDDLDKEYSRKFREVAQSYTFCLSQYYLAR